jgi:hypothetical protein
VHYGPYGYSKTGHPRPLIETLEELAQHMDVLTFFHELYASGPPWKRAFWTNREQKQSVQRLERISRASFTSNAKYVGLLGKTQPADRPLIRIPIFSNMGEPQTLLPLTARRRQLVVFGQKATRLRLYQAGTTLEECCRWLRIETIVDVGSGNDERIPASIAGVPVHRAGWLDEQSVSALLSESIAGVVGYWPDVWEKSGILAAYEAHALLPILVPLEKRLLPKPAYVPYLEAVDLQRLRDANGVIPDTELQQIAGQAQSYYIANQSLDRCAQTIAAQISK